MKAIYLEAPQEIKIIDIPKPEPQEGEALIKVKAAGICGSDIGAYRGLNPLVSYPRVLGHEIAGEVISIPENVKGIKPGDKVAIDPYLYCGHCYPCSIGRTNCCEHLEVLGVHVDGGMVEYFNHPAELLHKVPDDMPWEMIPLAEPLTIALHGLHRAHLAKGEHIVISGAGPIGLLAAMAAIYYEAEPIILDPVEERLDKAKQLGIKYTLNPAKENVAEKIKEITNGRMAEVVMEASGANSAIQSTLDLVSHAGRIVLTGWPKYNTELPTGIITKKEVDIRGARTSVGEFEEAIDLIYYNKIDIRSILTTIVSIDEASDIIMAIDQKPGDYLKVNILL